MSASLPTTNRIKMEPANSKPTPWHGDATSNPYMLYGAKRRAESAAHEVYALLATDASKTELVGEKKKLLNFRPRSL